MAAIGFRERGFEIGRRLRGEARNQISAAVVLDVQRVLEVRFRAAAQRRKFRRHRKLCRQLLGKRHVYRQCRLAPLPFRFHGQGLRAETGIGRNIEAKLKCYVGVRRRHRGGDRLAAAQQRGGPAARHARDRELISLRRKAVILQAQRNVGRGARPHRDRRIVGHQIKPLDIARRLRRVRRRNDQSNGESKGGEIERSHRNTPGMARKRPMSRVRHASRTATARSAATKRGDRDEMRHGANYELVMSDRKLV